MSEQLWYNQPSYEVVNFLFLFAQINTLNSSGLGPWLEFLQYYYMLSHLLIMHLIWNIFMGWGEKKIWRGVFTMGMVRSQSEQKLNNTKKDYTRSG